MKIKIFLTILALMLLVSASYAPVTADEQPIAQSVIFFSADGMRPDLMEGFAADKVMPTYRDLMKKGATGENGLLPAFPPNTGVGWTSLATGAWPGTHGSMNNTFHVNGDDFANRTSAFQPFTFGGPVIEAETIALFFAGMIQPATPKPTTQPATQPAGSQPATRPAASTAQSSSPPPP